MPTYEVEYRTTLFERNRVTAAYWDLDDEGRWFNFHSLSHAADESVCKTVAAELVKSITEISSDPAPKS